MDTIRWEFYPHVAENPHARTWLETQMLLGLAQSTIHAYGRGANDYLAFCQRTSRPFIEATKADIVAYIDDMTHQANPKGDKVTHLTFCHLLSSTGDIPSEILVAAQPIVQSQ